MDAARVTVAGMDAPVLAEAARQLGELFPAVYLALHRRDGKRRALPAASRAVLQHLTLTGPVRIGELARHLARAQSVVSEIVSHLERDGLLERRRDPQDARRTLVWLSGAGVDRLDEEHQVLSRELVERAMARRRAVRPERAAKRSSVRRWSSWRKCPPGRITRVFEQRPLL
jgi:DNA-binding MarR family transcriptional regulator